MCLSEWALRNKIEVEPEVLYAGALLERYGFIFSFDFTIYDAVNKAAKVITDHADETERLLMEGKQIIDKIALDEEPRIQDRRTYSKNQSTERMGNLIGRSECHQK